MMSAAFRSMFALAVAITVLLPVSATAQVVVESIVPPVLKKGKTARVTFFGKNLNSAGDVWHSGIPGGLKVKPIESHPDRAIFELEATTNASVGLLGLRVATQQGLSNIHLFMIDDLPVAASSSGSDPKKVHLPISLWGSLREASVDRYLIDVQAGQTASFEIVGSRFGKDADPLLTIRDARGKHVAERDNDPGLYFDSRFERRFTEAGTYTVEVRDARFQGSTQHPYVLRMGRFPAGRVALPAAVNPGLNELSFPELTGEKATFEEARDRLPGPFDIVLRRPNDEGSTWLPTIATMGSLTVAPVLDPVQHNVRAVVAASSALPGPRLAPLGFFPGLSWKENLLQRRPHSIPANVPGVFSGVLRHPRERHGFAFDLAKGQSIFVRAEAQSLNSPADLDVTLTDATGREQRRATDKAGDITLDFTATTPGLYRLVVRDQLNDGGSAFAYRLIVNDAPFPPVLLAEVEGLSIPQGSYQPIPLTITRGNATGPIQLKLLGAPAGMRLVPEEIDAKDNAIVIRLEADAKTPIGLAAIRILAETKTGACLVRTQPLVDRQIINVDQILLALREDQRRLPPSLTDRLAVQIIPAAPFDMELPESVITLPRYQHAEIPIVTKRAVGFIGPISFTAKGGQLGDKSEGRTRVFAELPNATTDKLAITGSIHSKILSNLGRSRIEITGSGTHEGRPFTLTRTFELNLTTAFAVKTEPAKVSLLPGETILVKLHASRVKSFEGDVALRLTPLSLVQLPNELVIPKGRNEIDLEIRVPADATPGKQNLQITSTALVSGYEEELRGSPLEIEVRKIETPKKK